MNSQCLIRNAIVLAMATLLMPACSTPLATPALYGLGGQRVEAEQTLAALDRQIAAATAIAQATRDAHAFGATATADTLTAAIQAQAATATAGAMSVQATQTAGAAALALVHNWAGATATAARQGLRVTQAAGQLQRAERTADLYALVIPLFLIVGLLALVVLFWTGARQYLDALDRRCSLVETRAGTILLIPSPTGPMAQVITPANLPQLSAPDDRDEFESDLPMADVIAVNVRGELQRFIPRESDPTTEAKRRLVLRLLRAAITRAGPNSDQLPGCREMEWPSATWTRAVAMLKPHVTAQAGRGGGVFCSDGYRSLLELYEGVGSGRLKLATGH